jgi:hypothetical protein
MTIKSHSDSGYLTIDHFGLSIFQSSDLVDVPFAAHVLMSIREYMKKINHSVPYHYTYMKLPKVSLAKHS